MSFFNAFRFLTIIPIPFKSSLKQEDFGRSLVFFPVAGLFIGLVLAGLDWTLSYIFSDAVVVGLVLVALAVITGALHLDGLIDSMDGLFVRGGPEKKLEVMKDSRAGSFGVVGAFLLLLLKYLSLATMPQPDRLYALMLFPALSRWCVAWAIFLFPYARLHGLGQSFKSASSWPRVIIATILALIISLVIFRFQGVLIMAGLWVLIMLAALFISRKLSGLTGDSYGALIELGDMAVLLFILILQE